MKYRGVVQKAQAVKFSDAAGKMSAASFQKDRAKLGFVCGVLRLEPYRAFLRQACWRVQNR